MPIIGNSPWTDAANYGAGLGQSLSQALLQLPQQRAEQQIQLGQLGAQQKQQGIENYFRQMAAQQQAQQAQQLAAYRQAESTLAKARTEALQNPQAKPQGNKWIPAVDKATGQSFLLNETTGEHKPILLGGVGSPGTTPMATPSQVQQDTSLLKDNTSLVNTLGRLTATPGINTNAPTIWNAATNALPILLQNIVQRSSRLGGAPAMPQGMPSTNAMPGNNPNDPLGLMQ